MIQLGRCILIMTVCGVLLTASGCTTGMKTRAEGTPVSEQTVTCIAIMPAVSVIAQPEEMTEEEKESLQRGIESMDLILARELGGIRNVRFVDRDHLAGLRLTGGESSLEMAHLAGRSIKCSAVLETKVQDFTDRVGGRYTVESPASAAFEMRLLDIESGAVLWSAKFDEVQKSVMENLYELGKARSRKFTWVTAEELMTEGVREKIAGSPYFQKSTAK